MTKAKKKPVKKVVATFDLKTTYSLLDTPEGRKKRRRGPGQIGQGKDVARIMIHGVTFDELRKRLKGAKAYLETGKLPTEGKTDQQDQKGKEAEEIRAWLKENEIKFHPQLGLEKLKALKEEAEKKTTEPGADTGSSQADPADPGNDS